MSMNLPGLGGDKPPQRKEEGPKSVGNGDKRPMNNPRNGKGKKEVTLSKQIIKESEHTLAFAWVGLGVAEFFKRPIKTSACVIGMFVLAGVGAKLTLGGGAALFSVTLPDNVSTSTQVGYIAVDVTKMIVVEGGKALMPAAGRVGTVAINTTNRAGTALVSTALDKEVIYREQLDRQPRESTDNTLLVNYLEPDERRAKKRSNNKTNLVRLPQ